MLDDVLAQVAVRYDGLGMPSWPDPHTGMASPRDEEYSRITEPARYRIVHARARAWAAALGDLPGVASEALPPAPVDDGGFPGRVDRGMRLTSRRPNTVPLLLLESDLPLAGQQGSLAVLQISVVRPEISLLTVPDCGCDACDWGSADLLVATDDTIGHVVSGPLVLLRGAGWHAHWHEGGGASHGTTTRALTGPGPPHAEVMAWCRRLAAGEDVPVPAGVEVVVGHPWLD